MAPAPTASVPVNVTVPLHHHPLPTVRCKSRSRLSPTITDPVRVLTPTRRRASFVMAGKSEKLDPVWDDLDRCVRPPLYPGFSSPTRLVADRPAMQNYGAHLEAEAGSS